VYGLRRSNYFDRAQTRASTKKGSSNISLPLRGRPLYIGDRTRDFWMRSETLKQQNQECAINGALSLEMNEKEEIAAHNAFL